MDLSRKANARRLRRSRLAWLPIPVLLAVMVVLWAADLRDSHESAYLLAVLNFVFFTLVSLFIAYLVARSFLVRGTPGLLLLGCGALSWSLAGVVPTMAAGDDVDILVTLYNSCACLSALCHLTGVSLSLRPRRTLCPTALWLPAAYALAAGAVAVVTLSALAGWMPIFFVQGQGGTPLRQLVLGSAVAMFGLTAILLAAMGRRPVSAFTYWYALGLALIASGLFSVMLQTSVGSLLGWTGRGTQYLGGVYMLIAAVVSVRESRVWQISLEAALHEEQDFNRAVLDTTGALVVVLDTQGRITRFNRACEQLTGYPAAHVLGRVFREFLIPSDEMAGVMEGWQALTAGSVPVRHENHWLTREGTRRLIDWSNTALLDEAGHVRHIVAIGIDITERSRAEEARKESEQRLHQAWELLEAVTLGTEVLIATVDRDFRYTFFNERHHRELKRLTGKDTTIGMSLMDVLADMAEEREKAIALWGRALRGETVVQTLMFGDPGHYRRWYNARYTPIRDADGTVVGAGEVTTDVTELMQAEEALRESEERLRLAQDGANVGVWDWTPPSGEIQGTPELERLYGLSPGTIRTYQDWRQRIHPDDISRVEAERDAAIATHRPFDLEYRIQHNSGEIHWIAAKGSAVYNEAGEVIRVLGMNMDITERKRTEEALRESQALMHAVMDGSPDLIYMKDTDGRVLMANPAACQALGRSAEEVIGKTAREFHSEEPDVGRAIMENDWRIMRSGKTEIIEELGLKGRTYLSTKAPYRDAAGNVTGLIGISHDITERRWAEEALRELNATLESKVAERTAELEQRAKQLQKLTLELAQTEDRERKRIAAILHEDLQQHIAAAKFHLGLLGNRVRHDPPQWAIADRVDGLLKEAIEKSRSLSHELSPAVLHMNDLAEVFGWLARHMYAKYGLAVHVDVRGEPTLQSEAMTMFLFRAVQEMLFNVIKHAEVHEAAIRVRRMGRYVCLSVADEGRGFDRQELKETTGFGLLSIHERVELLGGRMAIRSIKGRGSRFHIVVPDTKPPVR